MEKIIEDAFEKFADENGANSDNFVKFNHWHDMQVNTIFEAGWKAAMKHTEENGNDSN